jgi:gamma-tubulin complex component 3
MSCRSPVTAVLCCTAGEPEPGAPYLTLRRLLVWLSEPLRRMRLLALLADSSEGLEGGALAGAVHAHAQHGDPFVSRYMSRVLHAACVPLFDMIKRCVLVSVKLRAGVPPPLLLSHPVHLPCTAPYCSWVFEGALEDPHSEFFVRAAPWAAASAASARDLSGACVAHARACSSHAHWCKGAACVAAPLRASLPARSKHVCKHASCVPCRRAAHAHAHTGPWVQGRSRR